jgi:hypothetical protein
MRMSLDLLELGSAEQTRRPDHQHQDNDDEREIVFEGRGDERSEHRFHDADRNAANDSPTCQSKVLCV